MNSGGPAFPIGSPEMVIDGQSLRETQGMTLRDYFAAAALTGLIPLEIEYENRSPSGTAHEAYEYADAMIEERSRENANG